MSENLQVYINDREVKHFNGFSLLKAIDQVGGGFAFTCPFFPDTQEYREIFRPFAYQNVKIDINGTREFTGRIESITPQASESSNTVTVEGRALAGSIVDCNFEQADFPIQFTGAALSEIASRVLQGYDFSAVFDVAAGAIFEEAGPSSPQETIFNFLQNLAKQRQLLMSQNAAGNLVFKRAITSGAVVASLVEGQQGVTVSTAVYDSTQRFSSYDVFGQEPGSNDNYARLIDTVINSVTRRPKSVQANDTNAANITESAGWVASADLANAFSVPVSVEGWRRPDGQLWAENTLIMLQAPSIMIYKPFTFLVKSVELKRDESKDTAELTLALPGAYSGQIPEVFPWAE